jgi:hypothetical protein
MAVTNVGNSDTFTSTLPSDREVTLTRLFDAPRRLAFASRFVGPAPGRVRVPWGVSREWVSGQAATAAWSSCQ